MTDLIAELHGRARVQLWLAKADGRKIDKPLARFDDIVAEALQWAEMGSTFDPDIARSALLETVCRCVKDDPGYAGSRFNSAAFAWMTL